VNKLDNSKNFVIKKGNFNLNKTIRIRVISSNLKNSKSILNFSKVKKSLNYLSKYSNFALILINNSKIDKSEKDNVILRYYGIGAQIIKDLKVKNMILLTRSRKKIIGLEGFGLKIKKQEIIK
jgi:3,4-dihydroxy 2-butanone 4-phosphate synthase/GTP cyclohydrolase II